MIPFILLSIYSLTFLITHLLICFVDKKYTIFFIPEHQNKVIYGIMLYISIMFIMFMSIIGGLLIISL
jgi:hypothetical protein